ncbi:sigma 54-interacting transcriptional regulator [Halobacteriovorax sp. HLS]|uniref:sigma 54-interacting transcriptional regulator n=1 Tax=Halobacteriovorax sp. HLS TaxID=2234000 RepID=UPI000FDA1B67|nr:sigma 54-interacting transcriptional regulator [Halobacteriovorax sp. HLS]
MENIAKLKSYRSFRIPVKSTDNIYLSLMKCDGILLSDEHVKWELQNVSLTGVAFQSSAKFDESAVLEIELKYKRFRFNASAKIIRITPLYNEFSEIVNYLYGVEFFTQDQENGRDFISHFISGFSSKRLKRHLINLLINESNINTFSDGQKLALSMNLFQDMKQFKGMESFLSMIFNECCRISNSECANIFILNKKRDKLLKLDISDNSRREFCSLEGQDLINEVLSKKRYKIIRTSGHLSLRTFPSLAVDSKGQDFKHALFFPMLDSQKNVCGFFEFINFQSERGYTDRDLGVIEIFSSIFTMCYENLDKSEYVDHLVENFEFTNNGEIVATQKNGDKISEFIESTKSSRDNILIQGSHGVGKIHLAKKIHEQSDSANMSFGQIHCESIGSNDIRLLLLGDDENVGRLELYSGGTLLIHEPTKLSLENQKVLREELSKREDIRIIVTTVFNLEKLSLAGEFDTPLLDIISVNDFFLEDLKERKSDIPYLINHFLDLYCHNYGLPAKRVSPQVMEVLKNYTWPGNVGELERTVERLVNYYPYIRFIDELPQKEFPVIGQYARQFGLFRDLEIDFSKVDNDKLKSVIISRFCDSHGLTESEFLELYPELEQKLEDLENVS